MIVKMKDSGFCFGVRNAINQANGQYDKIKAGEMVYLFGEIIHNKNVTDSFTEKGYIITDEIKSIPNGSNVIIRAHGVPCSDILQMNDKNLNMVDCTCKKVKKIHSIVEEKSSQGYKVIIIGKENHAEVIGIKGWCSDSSLCEVIPFKATNDYLDSLNFSGKLCVVAQTTTNRESWIRITEYIKEKNNSSEIFDTLCGVTNERERNASAIAETVDVMVVIGDKDSSNSIELKEKCENVNSNTHFIGSLSDLISIPLNYDKIGLAASASTPDNIIDEVYNYLMFVDFMRTAKIEIDNTSLSYFDDFKANAVQNKFVAETLESLMEQHEGGKRIRASMIKLGEKIATNKTTNGYLPLAVGYEVFQTSILVHDDIMDKGDTRRNKETIHIKSAENVKCFNNNISNETASHFGMSDALCAGMYGYYIAYEFMMKNINYITTLKAINIFTRIAKTTCEGEIMDVKLPYFKISILNNYDEYVSMIMQIYKYKTAWYTLTGPVIIGAVCGGADENDELCKLLEQIMMPLGIAFQLKDDLLGIYSSEKVLGKSVLSDMRENKQTLLYGYAYKNATENERALLDKHYGNENSSEKELEIIKNIFDSTGAKKYIELEIKQLSQQSKKLICNDLINLECQSILMGLISYSLERKF